MGKGTICLISKLNPSEFIPSFLPKEKEERRGLWRKLRFQVGNAATFVEVQNRRGIRCCGMGWWYERGEQGCILRLQGLQILDSVEYWKLFGLEWDEKRVVEGIQLYCFIVAVNELIAPFIQKESWIAIKDYITENLAVYQKCPIISPILNNNSKSFFLVLLMFEVIAMPLWHHRCQKKFWQSTSVITFVIIFPAALQPFVPIMYIIGKAFVLLDPSQRIVECIIAVSCMN